MTIMTVIFANDTTKDILMKTNLSMLMFFISSHQDGNKQTKTFEPCQFARWKLAETGHYLLKCPW